MREFIITDEQLERLGGLAERINDIDFTLELGRICRELREIVLCRDCAVYDGEGCGCSYGRGDDPDGFCAWGERSEE